jgi:hypothetical protein
MVAPLHPSEARRRWTDLVDRLCCTALLLAGVAGAAWLVWYVWQMPAPR